MFGIKLMKSRISDLESRVNTLQGHLERERRSRILNLARGMLGLEISDCRWKLFLLHTKGMTVGIYYSDQYIADGWVASFNKTYPRSNPEKND